MLLFICYSVVLLLYKYVVPHRPKSIGFSRRSVIFLFIEDETIELRSIGLTAISFASVSQNSTCSRYMRRERIMLNFHCYFIVLFFHSAFLYFITFTDCYIIISVMVLKTLFLQNPRNITHVLLCLFCRTSLESWFYFNILQVSLSKYGVIFRIWLCLIDVKWPSSQDSPYQRSKFLSHVFLFWSWFNFHSQL